MFKRRKSDPVAQSARAISFPDQIRVVLEVADVPADKPETRWPKLACLVTSALLGVSLVLWFAFGPQVTVETPAQYLANLAAKGVTFGALAVISRAFHAALPDVGFDVSEKMFLGIGAGWIAIVALVEISVLGTSAIATAEAS